MDAHARHSQAERDRVGEVYRGYAASAGRRRAWAQTNPGNVLIRRELVERIMHVAQPELRTGTVLDLGCGTGWALRELAARGVAPERLHGVELLDGRAALAARAVPEADVRAGDARGLPHDDDSFDLVLMVLLLSSMRAEDVTDAIGEALRVLAPAGLLLCYEPRIANPLNRSTRLVGLSDLREGAGEIARVEGAERLTVVPALARRLGSLSQALYPRLAGIPGLLTHRLVLVRGAPRP